MKRVGAVIVRDAEQKVAMLGTIMLVDLDTGEPILPIRDVELHYPMGGAVSARVDIQLSDVEPVSQAEWNRRFPDLPIDIMMGG